MNWVLKFVLIVLHGLLKGYIILEKRTIKCVNYELFKGSEAMRLVHI